MSKGSWGSFLAILGFAENRGKLWSRVKMGTFSSTCSYPHLLQEDRPLSRGEQEPHKEACLFPSEPRKSKQT